MPPMPMTRERPTFQVKLATFRQESCLVRAPTLAGELCCRLHRLNKRPLALNALLMTVVMRYAATGVLQVHLIRREVGLDFEEAHKTHRGCQPIFYARILNFTNSKWARQCRLRRVHLHPDVLPSHLRNSLERNSQRLSVLRCQLNPSQLKLLRLCLRRRYHGSTYSRNRK